jgi:YggT family protein
MVLLSKIADPALNLGRRAFPLRLGGMDFSPIVLIIVLTLLSNVISQSLQLFAHNEPLSKLGPFLALQLLNLIQSLIFILGIIMVVRLIFSLANPSYYNPLVMFVYGLTEPLLAPLRRWFPQGPKGLDIKAMVFVIGLIILYIVINQLKFAIMRPMFGAIG